MKTYLEAYRERMESNNTFFLGIAEQFKKLGVTVYTSADTTRLVSSLYLQKDGKHLYFGFSDVPYRFYLSYDIEAALKQGSGRTLKEQHGTVNEWTVEYIVSQMQPIPTKPVPGPKPTQYMREL